ncbi:MAG: protein kinase [Myxococcota bacterium]
MLLRPINIGGYELHAVLGTGGMGEVWKGVHRVHREPVAIKVIRGAAGLGYTLAFRNEVRQIAKLDHPHIIRLLDQGEITEPAAEQSGGRLRIGAPFLVMERASAGTLTDALTLPMPWTALRDTLVALLQALAHAHARGVLHRDLTPRNVLFSGPDDPTPGLKLADFGLATAEPSAEGQLHGGTPTYMAPEQFDRGHQGPWTDLYSLGCVAWELATGSPPFRGRSPRELRRQHASSPVPPLLPRMALPHDFEAWVLRLLSKEASERFRFAADALRALQTLGPVVEAAPTKSETWEPSAPTWTDDADDPPIQPIEDVPLGPVGPRTPLPHLPPSQLTGLGLVGLRLPRLVGRASTTDDLWRQLAEVWRTRRPQLVALRGAVGNGKTHLARALAWQAQEQLGAEVWTLDHTPLFDPAQGLRPAVAAVLGCTGQTPAEAMRRIEKFVQVFGDDDPDDPIALKEYLFGGFGLSVAVQHALILRVLGWLTVHRPLVLVADNLQWGPQTAEFLAVLAKRSDLPVLVLATLDEPGPTVDLPSTTVERPISVLDPVDQRTLIDGLAPLQPALRSQVVNRTGGSPLFAEGLVADWVQRQVLEPTPTGFRLTEGAGDSLPDSLHLGWLRFVDGVLLRRDPIERQLLHAACALGIQVERADWEAVCDELGLPRNLVPGLMGAIAAAGLATQPQGQPATMRFAHPLVWESLKRDAVEHGTWEALHVACARVLTHADPPDPERLGLHWFEAGQREAAFEPLVSAARSYLRQGGISATERLLEQTEQALVSIQAPESDVRWGQVEVVRSMMWMRSGEFSRAQQHLSGLGERARQHEWTDWVPVILRYLGLSLLKLGRLLEAEAMFSLAKLHAEALDTAEARKTVAACAQNQGTLLRLRGKLTEALPRLEESYDRFNQLNNSEGMGDSAEEIANARLTLGQDDPEAERWIRKALDHHHAANNRVGAASATNTLGAVLRQRGALDAAEAAFRQALTQMDRLGSGEGMFPLMNLGLIALTRGDVARADRAFADAQRRIEEAGRAGLLPIIRVCRLPGTARLAPGDGFAAFDSLVDQVDAVGPSTDLAFVLEVAGVRIREAGSKERAVRLWQRATWMLDKLGQAQAASRIAAMEADS